jgi:hypothetical protein
MVFKKRLNATAQRKNPDAWIGVFKITVSLQEPQEFLRPQGLELL